MRTIKFGEITYLGLILLLVLFTTLLALTNIAVAAETDRIKVGAMGGLS